MWGCLTPYVSLPAVGAWQSSISMMAAELPLIIAYASAACHRKSCSLSTSGCAVVRNERRAGAICAISLALLRVSAARGVALAGEVLQSGAAFADRSRDAP